MHCFAFTQNSGLSHLNSISTLLRNNVSTFISAKCTPASEKIIKKKSVISYRLIFDPYFRILLLFRAFLRVRFLAIVF